MLMIPLAQVNADIHMGAFHLAVNCLADVMQQTGTLCLCCIDAQFSGKNTGDMGNLNGMLQDILSITGAVTHAAQQLNQLRMQAMDAGLQNGTFTFLLDDLFHLAAALFDHFFDAGRMNPSVNNQLFQCQACNFTANRIKAGQRDCLRRIINNEINTGQSFQCADIAAFTANDTALHLIIRQRDNGNGCFCHMVCGTALDCGGNDLTGIFFRFILGLLLDFPQLDGSIMLRFLLNGIHQEFLCFITGQSGNAFQTFQLLLLVQLSFLAALLDICQLAVQLFAFLFCCICLAIQRFFLLCQTTFGFLHFAPAVLDLTFKVCTVFVDFFLCFQQSFTLLAFRSFNGIVDNALGFFLSTSDFPFRYVFTVHDADNSAGDYTDNNTNYNTNNHSSETHLLFL